MPCATINRSSAEVIPGVPAGYASTSTFNELSEHELSERELVIALG